MQQVLNGPILRAVLTWHTVALLMISLCSFQASAQSAQAISFNKDWRFQLGNTEGAEKNGYNDRSWRKLSLPHDWSIELPFDSASPTGTGGGALRGGLGWYRKTFSIDLADKDKHIAIRFDGVYCNSEVWINGHHLGKRPNGYISFQYELNPWLLYGSAKNTIVVKVDNSLQPNSRWYSGSGIYRNVWLTITDKLHIAYSGSYFTAATISLAKAGIQGETDIENKDLVDRHALVRILFLDSMGQLRGTAASEVDIPAGHTKKIQSSLTVDAPILWSIDRPYLYKIVTTIEMNGSILDRDTTNFGIRHFVFDPGKGFILNDQHVKIRGVCNHHDMGCLGTAVNKSALRRQLQLLKDMGCNGIRTSHNPPAPELLDLCDEMGFIVMDESFDIWKKSKTDYDYHVSWDQWHRRDLEDFIRRDRNHPSVFIWSLGNEIPEQWAETDDTSGIATLRELHQIVRALDDTRPTVTANNEINLSNKLLRSGINEIIGYNYNHTRWDSVFYRWGRKPFIVTESVSALQTRGHYDMPSDSIRRWPIRWDLPFTTGNIDLTCSAYDNCSTPWGSTHEETLREFERLDHVSGMYIWTGFDYIGEPTPYPWPARSSYFGIIDLAGFPKDVYYMYQSAWTNKPVLHLLPHWNWNTADTVDVWAYYNQADEVELFLNEQSLGIRKKKGDELHVSWRLPFHNGVLKAISRKNGQDVLTTTIKTAGAPARIILQATRDTLDGQANELAFITARIEDRDGNLVPFADNLVRFSVTRGSIAGTDNGNQTSLESFQSSKRKAFNGLCLAVLRSSGKGKTMRLKASAKGLESAVMEIAVQ